MTKVLQLNGDYYEEILTRKWRLNPLVEPKFVKNSRMASWE